MLERYWYETSPFLYTALGGFFLGKADSPLAVTSSILLLSAGGTILFLRRRHTLKIREPLARRPARKLQAAARR